ncbi:MAG: DinB family protein [Meiothermus sp.]
MTADLSKELLERYGDADHCLQQLECSRGEVLGFLDALPDERLFTRPEAETWSPAELMEHLASVEEGGGKIIRRLLKVARGEGQMFPALPPSRFRPDGRLLAPPETQPKGGLSRAALRERLEAVRSRLLVEVGGNEEALSQTPIYPHPFWGDLDALGWLQSLVYHEQHHLGQLQERLK